jgi:hypothetical protein
VQRFAKWATVLGLSAVMVVGTAGLGGASVDAKGSKAKFCKQAAKVGEDATSSGDDISEEAAAKLEKQLDKLAKQAPSKNLESATKEMADYFGKIADGDIEDISAEEAKDFGIATGTFGVYVTTKCLTDAIPDITLPDISLPDVTLPDISLPD